MSHINLKEADAIIDGLVGRPKDEIKIAMDGYGWKDTYVVNDAAGFQLITARRNKDAARAESLINICHVAAARLPVALKEKKA